MALKIRLATTVLTTTLMASSTCWIRSAAGSGLRQEHEAEGAEADEEGRHEFGEDVSVENFAHGDTENIRDFQ